MPAALKTLVVLLLVALLPLRAMAAVTVGFCATGYDDSVVAAHGSHGHGAAAHEHRGNEKSPGKTDTPSCGACVEHCSGAGIAPSAVQAVGAPAMARERMFLSQRFALAFLTDQLDRPPLA